MLANALFILQFRKQPLDDSSGTGGGKVEIVFLITSASENKNKNNCNFLLVMCDKCFVY